MTRDVVTLAAIVALAVAGCHGEEPVTGTIDLANAGGDGDTFVAGSPPAEAGSVGEGGDDDATKGNDGNDGNSSGDGEGGTPASRPAQTGPCGAEGDSSECYEGPSDTDGVGVCRSGVQTCTDGEWTACADQILPAEEACDGDDQDCDGAVDENLTLGSCAPDDVDADTARDECLTFRLVCENGEPTCSQSNETPTELCNGADDDCDGEIDEEPDTSCYLALGAGGCRLVNGAWQCQGICEPGSRSCNNGQAGLCTGQTSPNLAGEQCNASPAVDDDCDGTVDEGCPCDAGETQSCYTGPASTRDVGACKDGTQTCTRSFFGNYTWGSCSGQVAPGTESCENVGEDDDCDGDADDIDVEGTACLSGEPGNCALGTRSCDGSVTECVPNDAPVEELCNRNDDDCDGRTDEDFDLQNNEYMCGSCTNSCRTDQRCCGGSCANLNTSSLNCGACGNPCASGEICSAGRCRCAAGLTQCGNSCVDTDTNNSYCGSCNNACANGEVCVNGGCGCGGGNTYCNGSCRAPGYFNTNNDHCGSCNNKCTNGRVCLGTSCACASGETYCDNACRAASYFVDNNADCGSCNNTCTNGRVCLGESCGCPSGQQYCDSACRSSSYFADNDANCGSCGNTCTAGQQCQGDTCVAVEASGI